MREPDINVTRADRRTRKTMRAIVYREYGGPDVLGIEDVDIPDVSDDGVLVRILGTAVNPGDWDILNGRISCPFDTARQTQFNMQRVVGCRQRRRS